MTVLVGGAGHGIFWLNAVTSAPVPQPLGFFGTVPVAVGLAFAAGTREFPFLAGVHYIAGGWALSAMIHTDQYRMQSWPRQVFWGTAIGFGVYLAGHCVLWLIWRESRRI